MGNVDLFSLYGVLVACNLTCTDPVRNDTILSYLENKLMCRKLTAFCGQDFSQQMLYDKNNIKKEDHVIIIIIIIIAIGKGTVIFNRYSILTICKSFILSLDKLSINLDTTLCSHCMSSVCFF